MERHDDFVRRLESSRNGHFLIHQRAGRAILQVFAPGHKGKGVPAADVLARLELFGLQGYDPARVEEIVAEASGEELDLCVWDAPESVDSKIRVTVSEDSLFAEVEIEPPHFGGRPASSEAVERALAEAGVVHGIDREAVHRLVSAQTDLAPHVARPASPPASTKGSTERTRMRRVQERVAFATPARRGRSGRIKHHFNPRPRPVPALIGESASARVDFRELNVIQTCQQDALLAELLDPEPGRAGLDVRGKEIPSPTSSEARLFEGRNTKLSGDGRSLRSTIAGQVRIHDDPDHPTTRIDVEEVLELESVDYSTGHVDFPGTVLVRGTVLDGFRVKANGDIVIEKSVGMVHLRAGGDIVLSGGIVGRGQASIQTVGDIYARFVQSAQLHSRGNIFIEEASIQSRLAAAGDIVIRGGRGELIGGMTLCGRLLSAETIGARNETETVINVGVSPDVMERLAELEEEVVEKQTTLSKVELHLKQIEEANRGGRLNSEDEATKAKLLSIQQTYAIMLANLDTQRQAVYDRIRPNPDAAVEAEGCVHPGVEIHFGTGVKRYRVENRPVLAFSRFVLEEARIVLKHSRGG